MKTLKPWLLFWLLAVVLSCYIRLYPLRAHIWDSTYDKASLFVVYNIKKTLLEQIHIQAPQIPLPVAEQMASAKLNETLRKDSTHVQAAIERVSQQMFDASKTKPNIYLLESDPFYFYYLTQNIIEKGHMAKQIKGSKYFEELMTAPNGYWQPLTYHPYVGAIVYKICKVFNPDISLMAAVAYVPLIIMALVLAAFLLLCFNLDVSAGAAFITSLFFVMAPVILKRSSLGWYDTDPYNLLFPLLILTVVIKALVSLSSKAIWISSVLFALLMITFASIWQGWGFMLIISLAILGICSLYSWLLNRNSPIVRRSFVLGVSFVLATIVGISLLFSFGDFFILLKEGLGELQKFFIKGLSLWPNLFMEVGELKRASTADILVDCGGFVFLLSSCLSLLYAAWLIFKNPTDKHTLKIIALATFLFACVALTIPAERFDIFALMGLALFLSIGLDALLKRLSSFKLPWLIPGVIVILTLFVFINAQKNIRVSLTPIFNAAWERSLIDIKNKTPEDSIINTWWPPGHFIKGIANRRVMFDGATLGEGATGYWMANILLSQDENQAAGLLRMTNLGRNKAVDFLAAKGLKTSQAVALLTTIASKSNSEATPLLNAILNNKDDVRTLLMLTRGGSPHSYVLLYNEMVDQNLGLVFMGHWNIQRVEQLNENPSLLASVPARNSIGYIDFLWSLAGGQSHYSPPLQLLGQDDQKLSFGDGLVIDKSTMTASINSPTYGQGQLASVVYQNGEAISEKLNFSSNLKYSVVLYNQDGQTMVRLMDQSLANSLLIKLFFFNGVGLEHFKPLTSSNDETGRTQIKVFEVNYN